MRRRSPAQRVPTRQFCAINRLHRINALAVTGLRNNFNQLAPSLSTMLVQFSGNDRLGVDWGNDDKPTLSDLTGRSPLSGETALPAKFIETGDFFLFS